MNYFCGDAASCLIFSMRFSVEGCIQPLYRVHRDVGSTAPTGFLRCLKFLGGRHTSNCSSFYAESANSQPKSSCGDLPHNIPCGRLRLRILENVEAPDDDTLGSNKMRQCDIHVPMEPCPKFVSMANWVLGELNVQFNNWRVTGTGEWTGSPCGHSITKFSHRRD